MIFFIGIPINVNLYKGNKYDSNIFIDQLNDIIKDNIIKTNNKNIFIGNAGYDLFIDKSQIYQ